MIHGFLMQIHINYEIPLWGVITYVVTQIGAFIYFIIKLINTTEKTKDKARYLQEEIEKVKVQNKADLLEIKVIHEKSLIIVKETHDKSLIEIKSNHKIEMDLIRQLMKEQTLEIRELRETLLVMKSTIEIKTLSEMRKKQLG